MINKALLFVFSLFAGTVIAQTDSLPIPAIASKTEKITASRQELLGSFLLDDPAGTGLWMDSLAKLEDSTYAGLIWDERWLLYFWTEAYGTLLEEVSVFDAHKRAIQSWKIQPQKDGLFEAVDQTLHEKRYDVYSSIRNAFLNEEEKAFTTLLFDYLLRQTGEEEAWAERLQSFEDHYPASRFLAFIRSIKPAVLKPANKAFGLSGGLMVGTWRGDIERTLNTPYAFQVDAYYWTERWNFLFDAAIGGPKITRDIYVEGDWWPKDDPTSFFVVGMNVGYDLINAPKIRVFPSVGFGFGFLHPPTPDEDEEPLPDYYEKFKFKEIHPAAALTADVKLFRKNYRDWNTPKGSYHGVRLKFGWNGLNLGKEHEYLQGDLVYFAVQYNFFAFMVGQ